MEIYLPMKRRVRTKIRITNNEIRVYQQKRPAFFIPLWCQVETTADMLEYIANDLKPTEIENVIPI